MRKLGLIAGNGKFPLIFAEEAKRQGVFLVAVAHRGETSETIQELADAVTWIHVGELGKVIRTFHEAGIEEAVMAQTRSHKTVLNSSAVKLICNCFTVVSSSNKKDAP